MVKNKELQEQRMKGYFIQATKDILKGEGLKGISVRNIAEQAGYSYATLYNYFRDVNDLVFLCVADFQEECKQFVDRKTGNMAPGIDRLKASVRAYALYFVEYPGIFDLFYLVKGGDFGNRENILGLIGSSLDDVCREDWEYCLENKLLNTEQEEDLRWQMKYAVIGLLTLYLNRLIPRSYTAFMIRLESLINNML